MEIRQRTKCFDGELQIHEFKSAYLKGNAKFSIYLPPKALQKQKCATLFFLAGLTCTEETFAIKAHAQKIASTLGLILVLPDTSPRGDDVEAGDNWDIGQGAGFYIDATEQPWATHYNMESYIVTELYEKVIESFPVDANKIGVSGHSMGGHGALTLAWKYPNKFKTVSAFAPICAPIQCAWGQKAFTTYLGQDQQSWFKHDAVELIKNKGALFQDILIDQGTSDQFYSQLNPNLLVQACRETQQKVTFREHEGYDHGYYFIQTFIADHLRFHFAQLNA